MHVLVMAKSPAPGRVKTRLCPPLDPEQAAQVAEACLAQTLQAVARCSAERKLLALDGEPGGWLPPGFVVFPQRGRDFAARLANAWDDAGWPGLQIGMDTPQVTPEMLDAVLAGLRDDPATAVLGPACDGGWWAIGAGRRWPRDVFAGVPMSTRTTGLRQSARLREAGLAVRPLERLRDIDTVEDAVEVAAAMPGTRLGSLVEALGLRAGAVSP